MRLGEFLTAAAADRGPWNCSTLPADWCLALGYPDFAAKWRGVVDPPECEEAAAAGLAPLWEEGIGGALAEAEAPFAEGDIGVVRAHGLEAGAVFTGERWALRLPRGLAFARIEPEMIVKAWRPCPRP